MLILILSYLFFYKLKKIGIYVIDKDIVIKKMCTEKKYTLQNIRAVCIVKSVYKGKYNCVNLKDFTGRQLYTLFLLTDYRSQMYNYTSGDFTFMIEFNEYILGGCVYDNSFFNWLLKENPQIKVIDNR